MAVIATGQATITDLNDAKHLTAFIGGTQSKQVKFDGSGTGTYTPLYSSTNNVLTPELYVTGETGNIASQVQSTKWYYQTNSTGSFVEITATGTDYTLTTVSGNLKSLTLKTNLLTSNTSMNYMCELVYKDTKTNFDITIKAEYEVVKLVLGVSAFTAVLSNDAQTIGTNNDGTGGTWNVATTTMYVYKGDTDDSANWTFAQSFTGGLAGTASGSPANRTFTATGMTGDNGTCVITATRSGYATLTRTFSVTKAKMGGAPTTYWLASNSPAIRRGKTGSLTPNTLVVTGKAQTGLGAPADYAGRFIIQDSTDGSAFTTRYTSSANETTYSYSLSSTGATVVAFRVKFYLAGGTTTVLDEQTIPVVVDGTDSVMMNVWTPDGAHVRNQTGSVSVQADIYEGASTVTGTAYKWYAQDPTSSTSAGGGGDTDGGAGWRLMTAVANPTTAPTLNGATAGGTLTAATYYVKYTWVSPEGETQASSEANIVMSANFQLKITIPAFPIGVTGAKFYVGTATGVNKLQNTTAYATSGGTYTISAPISTNGASVPASNTAQVDNWGVTGFTTFKITVPASAIAGTEAFKCVATYGGQKYSGATSVSDISDPIQVNILGVTQFKNGEGSSLFTAQLLRAGDEIDNAGSAYNYTWYIYDSAGVKNNTALGGDGVHVGKTVTVQATDINGRGNLVCEVTPKP